MFFWQVYNKSVSSQYFHNRNLWSSALWCLNVVRTGFSVHHLCLFIVCKFSTWREEFPLIETAKIKGSTIFSSKHTFLIAGTARSHSAPPVCIFIKILLNTHSLNFSFYCVCSSRLWVSLLGNSFSAVSHPDSSRRAKGSHHHQIHLASTLVRFLALVSVWLIGWCFYLRVKPCEQPDVIFHEIHRGSPEKKCPWM